MLYVWWELEGTFDFDAANDGIWGVDVAVMGVGFGTWDVWEETLRYMAFIWKEGMGAVSWRYIGGGNCTIQMGLADGQLQLNFVEAPCAG